MEVAAPAAEEARFRRIFRRLHAGHPACLADEWLAEPCRDARGGPVRPIVWSRRNGAWRRSALLWVGAAPGNAGGRGRGDLGAHGTRIPFGGDVAGGNLDVLLGTVGVTRNDTFITATLNQLPAAGGGEPRPAEVAAPVGDFASSLHALRDTIVAVGPRLLVALGNVALRAVLTAARLEGLGAPPPARLLSAGRVERAGMVRGELAAWPETEAPSPAFFREWADAWGDDPLPHLLWITHPSAQNMSPYARVDTLFHRRMLEARDSLRAAVSRVPGREPPTPRESVAAATGGIYSLPEWRERIAPRHAEMDRLWREKGI